MYTEDKNSNTNTPEQFNALGINSEAGCSLINVEYMPYCFKNCLRQGQFYKLAIKYPQSRLLCSISRFQ